MTSVLYHSLGQIDREVEVTWMGVLRPPFHSRPRLHLVTRSVIGSIRLYRADSMIRINARMVFRGVRPSSLVVNYIPSEYDLKSGYALAWEPVHSRCYPVHLSKTDFYGNYQVQSGALLDSEDRHLLETSFFDLHYVPALRLFLVTIGGRSDTPEELKVTTLSTTVEYHLPRARSPPLRTHLARIPEEFI